jgi:hypothetical protein
MTDTEQAAALRFELEQRNLEHGGRYYFEVNADETADLASGCVPATVQAQARFALSFDDWMRRNAERPVRPR